ncbi:hypothetical protein BDD12DRAFT_869573 [Trichophaea hybrida]|nr:hypothetical protein BDD12DRAFT_869573 [Trichophaea hybrida]
MIIILSVLHRHPEAPRSVSYEDLFEIAVLSEKYDFYSALVEYGAWCTEEWIRDVAGTVGAEEYGEWIFVLWAFRERTAFREVARVLVVEGTTRRDGEMGFWVKGGGELQGNVPESVTQALIEAKNAAVERIRSICAVWLSQYGHYENCRTGQAQCNEKQLSYLVMFLTVIDMMPKEEYEVEERSIEEILEAMYAVMECGFLYGCPEPEFGMMGCVVHEDGECPREQLHENVIDVVKHVGIDLFKFKSRKMD